MVSLDYANHDGGHVGVKVNDQVGPYFETYKGLRHGDSLSPLLFDLAVDALAIIMDNARREGFVKGVLHETYETGVNMLMIQFSFYKMMRIVLQI